MIAYMPRLLRLARSLAARVSVPALFPRKMLIPIAASSFACWGIWSHTAMGKKVGSVGMPLDKPAYGLVQATLGIAGAQGDGEAASPWTWPSVACADPVSGAGCAP